MKESTLLRIALSFSLFGLVVLFILTQAMRPEETRLANLSSVEKDRIVMIKGVVSDYRDNGKTARLEISQPQTTEVFLFKSRNLSLRKGAFVEITGEVSDYNGRKEIIASQVDVLV
jgi:DNA/RNA endonuclease YhcR with UshA esterase domain